MMSRKSWLAIICIWGAVVRIAIPSHAVFTGGQVNFLGPDSYWRMQNARDLTSYGFNYDSLLALFGNAAIIIPVLLAVGVIIMVYFIGKRLFSDKAGLIAAAFLAFWPGEFMARTFLGAVDHHALEVFLTTGAACLVIFIVTQKKILNWKTFLLAGGVVVSVILYGNAWQGLGYLWEQIRTASPISQPALTTLSTVEARPLLLAYNYIPFLTAILAIMAGWVALRRGKGWQRWLLIAWAAFMWLATFYQVRFDYYLVVPVAIMLGFWIERMTEVKFVVIKGGKRK